MKLHLNVDQKVLVGGASRHTMAFLVHLVQKVRFRKSTYPKDPIPLHTCGKDPI